jgi:hypothetical protein
MTLRVYFHALGGHVHCRVFAGRTGGVSLAHVGILTFSEAEWPEARDQLARIAEVRDDDEDFHGTVSGHDG